MIIENSEQYSNVREEWYKLRDQVFEISAWEASEERKIYEEACKKRTPILNQMRLFEESMKNYIHSKRKVSDHE